VLSVTCAPDSTLAKLGDMAIDVGVREQSIVQTGSLTSMALFVLACLRLWSGQSDVPLLLDRAAAAGDALLRAHAPLAEALGTNEAFDRFFWLGSGMNRGFASEAMLKVKEMSFCQSEAYHTLEFRHGLGANAAERSLIAVLHTESIRAQESDVLSEMYALGVHTLALNAEYTASTERAHTLTLDNLPLPDWMRIPVFMPVVHLIGYHRALLNGRDPDKPENLHSFITLKALPS
jgi:glutamine---fructose-6-phosphate transaminase (isomerizing)